MCTKIGHSIHAFHLVRLALLSLSLVAGAAAASAPIQDPPKVPSGTPSQGGPQSPDSIQAIPNRPTFSTTGEAVQRGVFEVEYGLEVADGHQNINGLLKFGLTKNLELRFANNPIERDAGVGGRGDSGVGFKYRLVEENAAMPTVAVLYTAVLPTASAGLGAGTVGHAAGILISKDFGKHHLDFNEIGQWLGRQGAGGFDRNYFSALAYSYPITEKLGFSAEMAGFSRANADTPATITILEAIGYSVSPRLILDGGCYESAHGNLPRVTFFAGITYSVGNLYRLWHHR